MLFVFERCAKDEFTGAVAGRNACCGGGVIQPHHHKMEEVDEDLHRKCRIWEGAHDSTTSFFNGANATLDFSDMLCRCRGIDGYHRDVVSDSLEFIVDQNRANMKTGPGVDMNNALK